MKGYVQIYTGDGRGKTTAALGLAFRAAGAGLRVFIGQFMKQGVYSEIKTLKRFSDLITIEQYGSGRFVKDNPTDEEIRAAHAGMGRIKQMIAAGKHDLIIVEEGNVAASCGLFDVSLLLDLINQKPDSMELVITGRGAADPVMERADLVTEMQEIKHYFHKGVAARIGIEK